MNSLVQRLVFVGGLKVATELAETDNVIGSFKPLLATLAFALQSITIESGRKSVRVAFRFTELNPFKAAPISVQRSLETTAVSR